MVIVQLYSPVSLVSLPISIGLNISVLLRLLPAGGIITRLVSLVGITFPLGSVHTTLAVVITLVSTVAVQVILKVVLSYIGPVDGLVVRDTTGGGTVK